MRSGGLRSWLWWKLLPYYGWTCGTRAQRAADVADGAIPPPWWAFPLSWLHRLVDKAGTQPFVPYRPVKCDCDYCRGVPGARFEP